MSADDIHTNLQVQRPLCSSASQHGQQHTSRSGSHVQNLFSAHMNSGYSKQLAQITNLLTPLLSKLLQGPLQDNKPLSELKSEVLAEESSESEETRQDEESGETEEIREDEESGESEESREDEESGETEETSDSDDDREISKCSKTYYLDGVKFTKIEYFKGSSCPVGWDQVE